MYVMHAQSTDPPCSRWRSGRRWCWCVPWHGNACIGLLSGIGKGAAVAVVSFDTAAQTPVGPVREDYHFWSVVVDPFLERGPGVVEWVELRGLGWCLHLYKTRNEISLNIAMSWFIGDK